MGDFEHLTSLRGPSLAHLAEHVPDVLQLALAEADEYQVGEVVLSSYDFAPYALTGFAAAVETPSGGSRATTRVTVPFSDDTGRTDAEWRDVTLFGPGDVLGIDPGQVVRRFPAPGSMSAESEFHAHIELDRPELPWAFSAQAPGPDGCLRPWLALAVLTPSELVWEPVQAGLQRSIRVDAAHLPDVDELWAWSHVQAMGGPASLSARLSTAHAPVNLARLLSARVLRENTSYVACLVPTTEAGRRAGLGLEGGGLAPAWTGSSGQVRLPVYDSWEFRTAPDGDFDELARRLRGIAAPWEIGRRVLDTSRPGPPLKALGARESGRRQVLRCALFSPARRPAGAPRDDEDWNDTRKAALQKVLEPTQSATKPADLPLVGPRMYARGQRGSAGIVGDDWFAQLNLSPVHRMVAGLGTRTVVKDQEQLVQAAWAQVGAVEQANRELQLAELARQLATRLHRRLSKVDRGRLLQLTRPLAARVQLDGATLTLAGQAARSATPDAALSGAFRRTVRSTGPVARRLPAQDRAALAALVSDGGALRDFTRPHVEPDGIGRLSRTAVDSLDTATVAEVVGAQPDAALAAVERLDRQLADATTMATAVSTPELWQAPDTAFRPGQALGDRIGSRLTLRLDRAGEDPVAARSLGGLTAALATTDLKVAPALRERTLLLEPLVARRTPGGGGRRIDVRTDRGTAVRDAVRGGAVRGGAVTRGGVRGREEGPDPLHGRGRRGPILREDDLVLVPDRTEKQRLASMRTREGTSLVSWLEKAAGVSVRELRTSLDGLVAATGALELAPTPPRAVLDVRAQDLLDRLDPARTVLAAIRPRIRTSLPFDAFSEAVLQPVMAAPRFDRPMYQALDDYDREWLVPGLSAVAQREFVTLLAANDQFTEAYLLGLNDEMGRELLWRDYPTDARGTYFHRFWDPAEDELTAPVHQFARTRLGSHVTTGPPGQTGRAVIVLRGEIVRRYPDLTVMALKEKDRDGQGRPVLPDAPDGPSEAGRPLFTATLPPDVLLVGLDKTVEELRRPGWWIVLAEHPQAPRFVLHENETSAEFASPGPRPHGAAVAVDRLEHPSRVAFDARDFLPPSP